MDGVSSLSGSLGLAWSLLCVSVKTSVKCITYIGPEASKSKCDYTSDGPQNPLCFRFDSLGRAAAPLAKSRCSGSGARAQRAADTNPTGEIALASAARVYYYVEQWGPRGEYLCCMYSRLTDPTLHKVHTLVTRVQRANPVRTRAQPRFAQHASGVQVRSEQRSDRRRIASGLVWTLMGALAPANLMRHPAAPHMSVVLRAHRCLALHLLSSATLLNGSRPIAEEI